MFTPAGGSSMSPPSPAVTTATAMPPMIVTLKPAMIAASAVHGRHPARPAARGTVGVPGCGGSDGNDSSGGAGKPLGCMLVTVASRLRGEPCELGERSDYANPRRDLARALLAGDEDRREAGRKRPRDVELERVTDVQRPCRVAADELQGAGEDL